MRIANPLFDAAVKYLLEDNVIAKEFFSILTEKDILFLEFRPQEVPHKGLRGLTTMRFDFKALIKTKDNKFEKILLEVQKSLSGFQLIRFRNYVGSNYSELENLPTGKKDKIKGRNIPLMTIYILGFEIRGIDTPILQIDRVYRDMVGDKIIKPHKYFESLTHDSLIIQTPRLKMEAQTMKEKVLDIFNEEKYKTDDPLVLDFTGDMSDPKVNNMVLRLNMALADSETFRKMRAEQAMLEDEKAYQAKIDRRIAKSNKLLAEKDEVIAEKDEVIAEKDEVIAEKDEVIAEKDEVIAEKDKLLTEVVAQKDEAIAEKDRLIAELLERERRRNENG